MSVKHPIVAVTGSSGAGTSTVKKPLSRFSVAKASPQLSSKAIASTVMTVLQ